MSGLKGTYVLPEMLLNTDILLSVMAGIIYNHTSYLWLNSFCPTFLLTLGII